MTVIVTEVNDTGSKVAGFPTIHSLSLPTITSLRRTNYIPGEQNCVYYTYYSWCINYSSSYSEVGSNVLLLTNTQVFVNNDTLNGVDRCKN